MALRCESSGKALKVHGRVSCPGGPCFAGFWNPLNGLWLWRHGQALGKQWQSAKGPRKGFVVDRASQRFWNLGDMARHWESSGKALKRPTEGFRVVVDRASPRFWNLNGFWRHGQALGKQWQGAKGPRKGFVSWWTVRRSGFESLYIYGLWRHGQALGRQWQSAKGPRKGFIPWWTVLRSGFETL